MRFFIFCFINFLILNLFFYYLFLILLIFFSVTFLARKVTKEKVNNKKLKK